MDKIGPGALVYIDTNIFVYLVEVDPRFYRGARKVFQALEKVEARIVASELTIAECLYQPSRMDNSPAVEAYERLFASGEIEIIPLDGALAKRASMRGGKVGLKLIDAVHYFAALEYGCEVFLTIDSAFRSGPKMRVVMPEGA